MKTEPLKDTELEDAYKDIPKYSIGNGMYAFNSIADYGRACIRHGANWQKEKENLEPLLSALKKALKLFSTVGSQDWWFEHGEGVADIKESLIKAEQ